MIERFCTFRYYTVLNSVFPRLLISVVIVLLMTGISLAIVGDITPSDGIPKEEKSRREQAALNEMCEVLGGGMRGWH